MSGLTVTKTRLANGIWHGIVQGSAHPPRIVVICREDSLPGIEVSRAELSGQWHLKVPIPADTLADGIQTFLITEAGSSNVLASFAILAGDALGDEIRADVNLLRAELDLLKSAFRRHCAAPSD